MSTIEELLKQANGLSPEDRRRLVEELEQGLGSETEGEEGTSLGSWEEIPGQLSGYWLAPEAEPLPSMPAYLPTGAVLPRPGSSRDEELLCLDLVPVEGAWFPLSEAGRYTYAHSEGLLRGERWRFLCWPDESSSEPEIYEARYTESLSSQSDVARLYGAGAARRSRGDQSIVQLALRRLS